GQLLTFQPETGSISLNLNVTKNLFQALGGKLIVKQRPQQGEVMTVFLPLADLAKTPLPGIG
ncbi:MAG: sensor histidine kinase, partial [Moorea sp. SIO4G2]|nr:sensor histidine kinase [Moorena sp. SIO4G2]NEO64718.1 sensor histidine kinase [Moorena sp. SIO4G2]